MVDLTQPLGPSTPVIGLPPMFASSPGVTIDVISKYDDKGPAWYWNTIRMGEHTGTHFDAPIHWITGKDLPDNACDTIPAVAVHRARVRDRRHRRRRRAIPISCSRPSGSSSGRASTDGFRAAPGSCCGPAGAGAPTPRRSSTPARTARTARGSTRGRRSCLPHDRDVLGVGVETIGTDAGQAGTFDSALSQPCDDARRRQVRAREPVQSRSAAADRRDRDCGAAQDRQWERQSAPSDRHHAGLTGPSQFPAGSFSS